MSTELPSDAASKEGDFGSQILEVCWVLEAWRKEENQRMAEDPNDLPETDWRVAAQALFFLGAGGLVLFLQSWLNFVQGYATLGLYFILFAICMGTSIVLMLHAAGLFSARFWRALWTTFTTRTNFPFAPLTVRIERNVAAVPRLASFSDHVLRATAEHLSSTEARLRDGLVLLGGNSSLPALVALVAGVWGGWRSFWGQISLLSMATLAGAIVVFWLSAYALNSRFSLFELTRCRELIAFELTRRKACG
jgi:hypothetical protein